MKPCKVEPFKDARGKNRVRFIASNGRNTYSSQGYHNLQDLDETLFLNMVTLIDYFRKKGVQINENGSN